MGRAGYRYPGWAERTDILGVCFGEGLAHDLLVSDRGNVPERELRGLEWASRADPRQDPAHRPATLGGRTTWHGQAAHRPARGPTLCEQECLDRMTTIDDSATRLWATYALEPCSASRNALVVHYAPLVRLVAARTKWHTVAEFDDLVGAGMVALIRAVERYDPTLGVAFSTFARWPLRGAMMDTTRRRSRRERHGALMVSLDTPIAGTDDWYHDPPDAGPGPADVLDAADRWRELVKLVNRLEPRLRFIVAMVDIEGRSQAEVADMLGLTPTWVCQLHARARRKLLVMARTIGYAHDAAEAAAKVLIQRAAEVLGASRSLEPAVLAVILDTLARPQPSAS